VVTFRRIEALHFLAPRQTLRVAPDLADVLESVRRSAVLPRFLASNAMQ